MSLRTAAGRALLRRARAGPAGPAGSLFGVITSIQSGSVNSLTVQIGAGNAATATGAAPATAATVTGVRYADSLTPAVGKQVVILYFDGVPWVIGSNA